MYMFFSTVYYTKYKNDCLLMGQYISIYFCKCLFLSLFLFICTVRLYFITVDSIAFPENTPYSDLLIRPTTWLTLMVFR